MNIDDQKHAPPMVLVVDDDADARDMLRDVLEQAGYAVGEAANGSEALAYLEQNERPSAIVLDLSMPVMDGWQFAAHVQSTAALRSVPILVVTAREAHWGYPSSRVFRKPIAVRQLLKALDEIRRRR
jgi:CheY-like chemotaxis protein